MGKTSIIDHSLHYNCKKAIKSTAYFKLRMLYFTYILGPSTKSHRYIHSKQNTHTIRVKLMSSATPVPFLTFQPHNPSVRVLILDFGEVPCQFFLGLIISDLKPSRIGYLHFTNFKR